jgi:hypothetical protein
MRKSEDASRTIGEDHEIARSIRDHPSGNAAMDRFDCATVRKMRRHPRITVGTAALREGASYSFHARVPARLAISTTTIMALGPRLGG